MPKYTAPKGLTDRLFSLFRGMTYENIAEIFGLSRGTIGGWNTGASVPKLSELEKACELTKVDWQWLLTGNTSNIESLTYAFFPIFMAERVDKPECWDDARYISGAAVYEPIGEDLNLTIHTVAALVLAATSGDVADPLAMARASRDEPLVDPWDYYELCRNTVIPSDLLKQVKTNIYAMRTQYMPGEKEYESFKKVSPPAPNVTRPREPINFVLSARGIPVVGEMAADETQGAKAGFFPPDPEARYDEISFPETTSAVRIVGDSMSPVLLNGQYAFLGPEYMGRLDKPKNYEIVVADVQVRDDDQEGSDARWEGGYCKRIVDGGDVWVFLSINATGTPFSVAKVNCRLWPVIGVWFAGKGRPPRED